MLRFLFFHDVEPAQPLRFVIAGPQARIAVPQFFYLALRLPIGNRRFHTAGKTFWKGSLQSAHSVYPFWLVLRSTAANNFSKASANCFTPSSVSLSVTSFIEIPAFGRSSIVFCAPATSSVRLLRSFP